MEEGSAQNIFKLLHEHLTQDDLKVVLNICSLFDNLAANGSQLQGVGNSFFMTNIGSFIDILLQVAYRDNIAPENLTIVDKCLSAIVTMSQKCLTPNQFETTLKTYFNCLANSHASKMNHDRKTLTQEGLLIAITSVMWRVSRNNDQFPKGTSDYIDFDKEYAGK